jgi:hypothetical protein
MDSPTSSIRSRLRNLPPAWLDLTFLLVTALFLRLAVLFAYQRDYPLFEDFFIYYNLAENWLAGNGPVINFMYSYLHFPATVLHVEDYYEPFYSLLIALFMGISSKSFLGALLLPMLASLLAVGLTYLAVLRLGGDRQSALLAACLAVIHPLLIERASWLMKEAVMGALYLTLWLFILSLQPVVRLRSVALLAALAAGIGMIQYESMPILGLVTFLALLFARQWKAASVFALVFGGLILAYWGWFYAQSGLIVSTKYLFLLTPYSGAPFEAPRSLAYDSVLAKLLKPSLYIYRSTLSFLGLPLLLVAGRGLWLRRKLFASQWLVILLFVYLYVHGVAVDLWFQDYLVLLLLLFPYAALAISDWYQPNPEAGPGSQVRELLPWLVCLYCALFWLLEPGDLNQRLLFMPMIHSKTLVPLGFASLLLLGFRSRLLALSLRYPQQLQKLALLCFAFLVLDSLRLKPLPELFIEPRDEVYRSTWSLGQFVRQQLPAQAVLVVSEPFAASFFFGRPSLKLTEAKWLEPYRPDYAVGPTRQELESRGYQIEPYLNYAGQTIWKLKWP